MHTQLDKSDERPVRGRGETQDEKDNITKKKPHVPSVANKGDAKVHEALTVPAYPNAHASEHHEAVVR